MWHGATKPAHPTRSSCATTKDPHEDIKILGAATKTQQRQMNTHLKKVDEYSLAGCNRHQDYQSWTFSISSLSLHLQIIAFILTEHFSPSPVTGRHVLSKAIPHTALILNSLLPLGNICCRSHPQTLSHSFPKALNKQTLWAHETSVSAFLLLLSCFRSLRLPGPLVLSPLSGSLLVFSQHWLCPGIICSMCLEIVIHTELRHQYFADVTCLPLSHFPSFVARFGNGTPLHLFIQSRNLAFSSSSNQSLHPINLPPWCACMYDQSYVTLCDPVDCCPPASSAHRIFQARVLEWVAISYSRGSSQPKDQTQISCIGRRFFTTWEAPVYLLTISYYVFLHLSISNGHYPPSTHHQFLLGCLKCLCSRSYLQSCLTPVFFIIFVVPQWKWASPIAQLVKNPPAMQETLVWFLSLEDPLEEG